MQLLASWKDSLNLLKPANFKLFFLVTLKALKDTYKVWLKYWWWLIIGFIAWRVSLKSSGWHPIVHYLFPGQVNLYLQDLELNTGIAFIFMVALYTTLYLSCRASVNLKNYRYFASYIKHSLFIGVLFLLLPWLEFGFRLVVRQSGILGIVALLMVGWFSAFFILFLLDSNASLKSVVYSLYRALKMVLYNFPFCFILAGVLTLMYGLTSMLEIFLVDHLVSAGYINHDVRSFVFSNIKMVVDLLLFLPIVACFTTNYYIKRLHDQFNLYFEVK